MNDISILNLAMVNIFYLRRLVVEWVCSFWIFLDKWNSITLKNRISISQSTWNHRHDIETPQTLKFTIKGLVIGLIMALAPTIIALRLRRKLKILGAKESTL